MSSVEPEHYANQHDCGKKSVCQLVVAGSDGAKLLELVEEPFDEIALAVEGEVGVAWLEAVGLGRTDGCDASALERVDQGVGVISFVGQKCLGLDLIEQRRRLADIGRLPRGERQGDGIAQRIDDGVNLGGQAAAGSADGLVLAFFFWAPALCW